MRDKRRYERARLDVELNEHGGVVFNFEEQIGNNLEEAKEQPRTALTLHRERKREAKILDRTR